MPRVLIVLCVVALVAALFVYAYTFPVFSSWPAAPWRSAIDDGTWIMLLVSPAIFAVYSILLIRRSSPTIWYFALAASVFPMLLALIPCAEHLNVASHSEEWLDAGADVGYQIAVARHVFLLSLVFAAILSLVATYGYFARRKT